MKNAAAALILAIAATGCMADIRPDAIASIEQPDPDAEARGRALLERAAAAQGADAFRAQRTYTLTVRDHWKGLLAQAGNPWPHSDVEARLSYRIGTFDGRAEFLNGKKLGWTWGLQSWRSYQIEPGGTVEFRKNKDATFILPALQYLGEFVFRDHSDKVVTHAGQRSFDGRNYEMVFVTWRDLEPTKEHDQYVAYIDSETGELSRLQYTIREFAGFAKGTIHYNDLREVHGVRYPFRQSITGNPSDSPDDYLHEVTVKSMEFGVPSLASFEVDEGLPTLGHSKVATR